MAAANRKGGGTSPRRPARVDLVFRAFADRTRLRILHLIREREVCVGDLVAALRLPQPTVSRHLAYLRRADLVRVRKEGLWAFYALAAPATPVHARLLDCLGSCFGDVPEIAGDAARVAALGTSGGCCPGGAAPGAPRLRRAARRR